MGTPETKWPIGPYYWEQDGRRCISVPFTWNLPEVRTAILEGDLFYGRPLVGGPAVKLMPDYLADVADIGGDLPGVLQRVNPQATRTTVGCPNHCGFCAVPTLEGGFRELDDWPDLPVICDNNLLAASDRHFSRVMMRLRKWSGVDFNQGLDARLLEDSHARAIAELGPDTTVRLSWDLSSQEKDVIRAVTRLRKAGVIRKQIRVYVLIGYLDQPKEALYRLETLYYGLGVTPSPQRYHPLDAVDDSYIGPLWRGAESELEKMVRYWSRLRYTGGVPYEEFDHTA